MPVEKQDLKARCSTCIHVGVCFKYRNIVEVAKMSAQADKDGELKLTIDPTTIAIGCSDYFAPNADLFRNRQVQEDLT